MLEGGGEDVPHSYIKVVIANGAGFAQSVAMVIAEDCKKNQKKKRIFSPSFVIPEDLIDAVQSCAESEIKQILESPHGKISRDKALNDGRHGIFEKLDEKYLKDTQLVHEAYSVVVRKLFREQILEDKIRCDGRSLTEVRPITSQVDLYKPLHGSALFQRGQTQVLCTVTFDSLESASRNDPVSVITGAIKEKNFMLHYEVSYSALDKGLMQRVFYPLLLRLMLKCPFAMLNS